MKLIGLTFLLFLTALGNTAEKPRVWIISDMSDSRLPGNNHRSTINDPDDISAMAGYLLMANEFDTRGITVTSTNRPDHRTTPDQAAWANSFFGKAYRTDVANLNKHLGGYPESIQFFESSIKKTAEKFRPHASYAKLDRFPSVAALLKEAKSSDQMLNILCWGSLSEPAIFVKHCLDSDQEDVLKKVQFIAHWTSSSFHMGTKANSETVPNCAEDAEACGFLKKAAHAGTIRYFECGAIGQFGIVEGGPKGDAYFNQFKRSRIGKIFAEGKYVRGKVDHSDSATYWVLLGKWDVGLDDLSPDGGNPPDTEKANEAAFKKASKKIHDELLRRAKLAATR
ncbi:MAG: DUF1593 domain-containing protein [Verrucomicrobiales bacterium]|nr:DUF1593 domain-containing protein [Verrucomicrobiales bacterium]